MGCRVPSPGCVNTDRPDPMWVGSYRVHSMAKLGSPEWLANVSEGTRRGVKPWNDGLRILGSDVQTFIRRGQVAPSLKAMVSATVQIVGEYAHEKGGLDQLTVGERDLLDVLFTQRVARSGLFSSYLRTGNPKLLGQALTFANAETRTVQLLGLERRAKEVPSLSAYLADKAAENASGSTIENGRGSSVVVETQVATVGEGGER